MELNLKDVVYVCEVKQSDVSDQSAIGWKILVMVIVVVFIIGSLITALILKCMNKEKTQNKTVVLVEKNVKCLVDDEMKEQELDYNKRCCGLDKCQRDEFKRKACRNDDEMKQQELDYNKRCCGQEKCQRDEEFMRKACRSDDEMKEQELDYNKRCCGQEKCQRDEFKRKACRNKSHGMRSKSLGFVGIDESDIKVIRKSCGYKKNQRSLRDEDSETSEDSEYYFGKRSSSYNRKKSRKNKAASEFSEESYMQADYEDEDSEDSESDSANSKKGILKKQHSKGNNLEIGTVKSNKNEGEQGNKIEVKITGVERNYIQ